MFRKKKLSEVDLLREEMTKEINKFNSRIDEASKEFEERFSAIEGQVEGSAARQSELSQTLENRSIEIRTQSAKEFKSTLDDVRSSLETLGIELNNQILELSTRIEKLDKDSSSFEEKYITVLDELSKSRNIAVEKEQIMGQKYEDLVTKLKEKEQLAIERENLVQQRIESLQEEIDKKEKEVEKLSSQIAELETEKKEQKEIIEELQKRKIEAEELKLTIKQIKEENEIKTYELERVKIQIKTMSEDTRRSVGATKAIKTFLSESESGRVLSHLMSIDQVNIDDLATMTGIATYTVQQIVQHFRDLGVITFDEATRRARLAE